MLVKAVQNPVEDPIIAILAGIGDSDTPFTELEVGSYLINHFSFEHVILGDWETYPELGKEIIAKGVLNPSMGLYEFGPYGVCDGPEQFWETELGKFIRESDRPFCVSFTHVAKADQPPDGGWRWHKWGSYIGKGEPQCEYLYDEEGFEDGIYTYHVFERKTVVNVPEIQEEIEEAQGVKKELAGRSELLKMQAQHNPNADIEALTKEIEELEKKKEDVEYEIHSAESRLSKMIAQKMRLNISSITLGKYWECPESPTGYCIYNHDEDPCHDNCLVCGDPEERK